MLTDFWELLEINNFQNNKWFTRLGIYRMKQFYEIYKDYGTNNMEKLSLEFRKYDILKDKRKFCDLSK